MLKSFFCVLPGEELNQFRTRLLFLVPAIALRSRGQDPRGNQLVTGTVSPGGTRPFGQASGISEEVRLQQPPHKNRDNSGSRERISSPRMRPDGTGGPNETN
jgi:hypothetical protein